MLAVTLFRDVVDRGGGGFTIWPGSAALLYPTSAEALNWVATEQSERVGKQIVETIEPVEFVGKAGDVLLMHGWTVHSAGLHYCGNIRAAVIQDINKVRKRGPLRWTAAGKGGCTEFKSGHQPGTGAGRTSCDLDGVFHFPTDDPADDPADGQREVTSQWIVDSNEVLQERHPPSAAPNGVFEHWNLGAVPVVGNVVDEPPWWEKYGLPMLPTGQRGGGGCPAVPLDSIAVYEGEGRWRATNRGNDWSQS